MRWPLSWLLPSKRPMDGMRTGVDLPQEDEFALCAMGAPTPYRRMAFPNQLPVDTELIGMDNVAPEKLEQFRKNLCHFFQALTAKYANKRLALKSPTHTGRLHQLGQWFPGSKFIHISRNPLNTVPSTIHLWHTLETFQGLQVTRATDEERVEFVLETFHQMYVAYFKHRDSLIQQQRLVEIQYEQLVAEPIKTISDTYDKLQLGGFDDVRPKLEEYFQSRSHYKVNPRPQDAQLAKKIAARLQRYLDEFGYST